MQPSFSEVGQKNLDQSIHIVKLLAGSHGISLNKPQWRFKDQSINQSKTLFKHGKIYSNLQIFMKLQLEQSTDELQST